MADVAKPYHETVDDDVAGGEDDPPPPPPPPRAAALPPAAAAMAIVHQTHVGTLLSVTTGIGSGSDAVICGSLCEMRGDSSAIASVVRETMQNAMRAQRVSVLNSLDLWSIP